jgi:hypothetical protein
MNPADSHLSNVEPSEAFELVVRELRMHSEAGRKNFVLRVPQDMVVYLISGILLRANLSMVVLEQKLSELEISGFQGSEDGRILRRYMSGETRMAWPTYRRLALWSLVNKWLREWVVCDLLFRADQREAAQLCARTLLNKGKRRTSLGAMTQEYVVDCFNETYLQLLGVNEQSAAKKF